MSIDINSVAAKLGHEFEIDRLSVNNGITLYEIRTPFINYLNDNFCVYLAVHSTSSVIVTDSGWTINELNKIKDFKAGHKLISHHVKSLLKRFRITLYHDELIIPNNYNTADIVDAIIRMNEGMQVIDSMVFKFKLLDREEQ